MGNILDKINAIESQQVSSWNEDAQWRSENREWLNKSLQIAIKILREIRLQKAINGMTQKTLAEAIGVTPQYINKVVKGQENLTLSTISKIEKVLGITLIQVPGNANIQVIQGAEFISQPIDRHKAKNIGRLIVSINQDSTYDESNVGLLADGTYGS